MCISLGILYMAYLWITLPDISDPRSLLASQSTVLTDRNGVELYRVFAEEDRTFVSGEHIPRHMKQAAVAIEDERYYDRGCLDVRAIARAVFFLGRAGGGSTITRQLARNALNLQKENRYQRKIKELILGCQLESRYDKEELLELYLNWIPFGRNAYGIEQASRTYFNTTSSELTLAQSAILASLPQRPSYFSPYGVHVHTEVRDETLAKIIDGDITSASEIPGDQIIIGLLGGYVGTGSSLVYVGGRTDQVLKNMEDQEFITPEERQEALTELETIAFQPARENIRAPHFVLWVRDQVLTMFAGTSEEGLLEQGGLRIETTLDWELQERAEDAIEKHREDILNRYGGENMALVSVDPETNEILAYVGNMDYNDEEHGGKIDMAQSPRQPGSSFKPFVYAAAFQRGHSPATPVWDVPTEVGEDEPQNFDGKFMGLLTMRQALGASRNVPAAKAYFLAGQENVILTLVSALGAPSPLTRKNELQEERGEFDYGWPLALGAAETPLLEMVNAYGAFARGGKSKPVFSIRRITDKKGNLLFQAEEEEEEEVIDERIAYQITSILSDESVRPEEYWRTQLTVPGYQTAAKTGTSNKCLEWKEIEVVKGTGATVRKEKRKVCRLRKPDNAWLVGYTPHLVTGVWVGNANSASMYEKAGGLNTASPIWRDFMVSAHRTFDEPQERFEVPDDIIQPQISTLSGQYPTPCTPISHRRPDVFLKEDPPTAEDPYCQELVVDAVTGLLASDKCPTDALASGSFLVARSLLPERWPTWEEGVQKWVEGQMELWHATADHSGAIIPLPIAPTEECDLGLTPGRGEKPTLRITSPLADGGVTYPTFKPSIVYNAPAGVEKVTYMINGKKITTVSPRRASRPGNKVDPDLMPTLRVPRSIAKTGRHTLRVELTDTYFNTVTSNVSFTFEEDERPPEVTFIVPRGDVQVRKGQELTLEAEAFDEGGSIKYVQFFVGEKLLSTKPKPPYTLSYTIVEPSGIYELKVIAVDAAGNSTEEVRVLTVD